MDDSRRGKTPGSEGRDFFLIYRQIEKGFHLLVHSLSRVGKARSQELTQFSHVSGSYHHCLPGSIKTESWDQEPASGPDPSSLRWDEGILTGRLNC